MNLNKVIVIGRTTVQPELRTTTGGQSVSSFGVATNRFWTDKTGARQEETEFHNVVVWGRQAEIATQYLTKGSMVMIEGRLRTRTWQDKEGQSRKTTEIVCERLQLGPRPMGVTGIEAKSGKANEKEGRTEEVPVVDIEEGTKDELPF